MPKITVAVFWPYLTDDEVEVILDENLHLLAKLFLHCGLAFAAQVRRRLTDATGYQSVAFTRHFFCNAACGLVYCLPLHISFKSTVVQEKLIKVVKFNPAVQ